MSDERNERSAVDPGISSEPDTTATTSPWAPAPEVSASPPERRRGRSSAPLWLGGMLVLVIAGVLASPFWAPALRPLLPWGTQSGAARYDALAQHLATLEARVARLEQRPVAPPIDADAIKSAQAAVAQRVTALEAGVATLRQGQQRQTRQAAATTAALTQQSQRLDAIAAQTVELDKLQQELAQRGNAAGELANRVDALEHQLHSQSNVDRSGAAMMLALLEMREAVVSARPFPAEFQAFKELAAHDPDLAAATQPLADAARDGVASQAVLRQRLDEIADRIATAKTPAVKPKWWEQAIDRLRSLVTIRQIDGTAKAGPDAAVEAAQSDVAQGNLKGAVAALSKLTGANAEAAQPWLDQARQRLAAEAALMHLQDLLSARLSAPAAASPAVTAPAPAAEPTPPAQPKTPS